MEKYFRSLFDCVYPTINEPIEWRDHPGFALKASNYGTIEPQDPDNEIVKQLQRSPERLIYECWTGQPLSLRYSVKPRNFNPYDLRPSNLVIVTVKDVERVEAEKRFIEGTIQDMIAREELYTELFGNPELGFRKMAIPPKLIQLWKEKTPSFQKNVEVF